MNKAVIVAVGLIIVGVAGFLLLGPKSTTAPTTTTQETAPNTEFASNTVSIETSDFKFSPTTIRVKVGGKISYTNKDSVSHTFTSDDGTSFDSGTVEKDQTVTVSAPDTPGSYSFHCTPHPFMKGTLIVE